ncbi:MAG: cytochrome-c peroxidase [Anaerolineae bacterium]
MGTRVNRLVVVALVVAAVVALGLANLAGAEDPPDPELMVELGEMLYFDKKLSSPDGQACADCHEPTVGFDDPDFEFPVSQGVLPQNRWGNRNSPISAYAMYAPRFHWDASEELWIGGQFWDGRATGDELVDPLADQALGPFLNPLEMNNPIKRTVIEEIRRSKYADLFEEVWGPKSLKNVEMAYDQVALSIAAFERAELFAQFSSKYDAYLAACLDLGGAPHDCAQGVGDQAEIAAGALLTSMEWEGLQLFMGPNDNDGVLEEAEGALCSACHVADWTMADDYELPVVVPEWAPEGMVPPVFTDFSFDNLGVPKNWDSPFLDLPHVFNPDGADFIDYGLGGVLGNPEENGKFKVMTLRNIGVSAPYAHNGFFTTLDEIVHFYNARDVEDLGEPEVPETVNVDELGKLGLSAEDEAALVAFMKTLTDGYMP